MSSIAQVSNGSGQWSDPRWITARREAAEPTDPQAQVAAVGAQATGTSRRTNPLVQLTQQDFEVTARMGIEAVPVRPPDPVSPSAKSERAFDAVNDRKPNASGNLMDALRLAALRRDAAAVGASSSSNADATR